MEILTLARNLFLIRKDDTESSTIFPKASALFESAVYHTKGYSIVMRTINESGLTLPQSQGRRMGANASPTCPRPPFRQRLI